MCGFWDPQMLLSKMLSDVQLLTSGHTLSNNWNSFKHATSFCYPQSCQLHELSYEIRYANWVSYGGELTYIFINML